MSTKKKKSDLGIVSGLVFGCLSAFIVTLFFTGEARTMGQMFAIAIGPTVGGLDWWKNQPPQIHRNLIIIMLLLSVLAVSLEQMITNLVQKLIRIIKFVYPV